MTDLATLLAGPGIRVTAFGPDSRYHGLAILERTAADGTAITYVARRFVPQPEDLEVIGKAPVLPGDRADRLAARHLGDATRWWQLADASGLSFHELGSRPGAAIPLALPKAGGGTTGA